MKKLITDKRNTSFPVFTFGVEYNEEQISKDQIFASIDFKINGNYKYKNYFTKTKNISLIQYIFHYFLEV